MGKKAKLVQGVSKIDCSVEQVFQIPINSVM